MKISDLPLGPAPKALTPQWFPTPFQAVIFRNWEMVPPKRLAEVLQCSEKDVLAAAEAMGLPVPPAVSDLWLKRGYVTIIRVNWHLLDYPQLLQLLGWDADRLNNALQNEDFLWHKLGLLKPVCGPVRYRELTPAERRRTAEIRKLVSAIPTPKDAEPPFAFLRRFEENIPEPVRDNGAFGLKLAYSYSALYGDALSMPELDPYPDGLLRTLAARGVNAIWLQVVLYQLYPWPEAPELSKGGEKRMRELNRLIQRAAKFGLKVYVYLNEPRGLPYNLFADRKDLREKYLGVDERHEKLSFCTSKPAAKKYLADSVEYLFRNAPGLGGAFTITESENLTHCRSRVSSSACPRCAKRDLADILAEVNTIIARAAHRADPEARILCWTWAWPREEVGKVVANLPDDVSVMSVSETRNPISVRGIRSEVRDYSLSHAGPSPSSREAWGYARARGLAPVAKIQLSNTWEGSSVPYIPVTRLVAGHLARLRRAGVRDLMVSWTLGGYPSINMDLLAMTHAAMVRRRFGRKAAAEVGAALDAFSSAFQKFPFNIGVVYRSPHNIGPANYFYPEPTGYASTMVGIPYDDLAHWTGIYPVKTYLAAFRDLVQEWRAGLRRLERAAKLVDAEHRAAYDDLLRVAKMCEILYAGAVRQARYVQLRNRPSAGLEVAALLRAEESAVREMLALAQIDSRFGFEATNHYAYTTNELKEKLVNLAWIQSKRK